MTDKLDAATIRELLAKITQGEWYNNAGVSIDSLENGDTIAWVDEADPDDADFIAAAPAIARYALELSDKVDFLNAEIKRLQDERNASVVYGAELYDQLQSQAAELERLRDILDKRRRYQ